MRAMSPPAYLVVGAGATRLAPAGHVKTLWDRIREADKGGEQMGQLSRAQAKRGPII